MIELRDYQKQTIKDLFDYIRDNPGKNPCVSIPTGGGKSVIIAEIVRRAKNKKVLMLTHVKELIQQNADKLHALDPTIPLSIFSAGLKSKSLINNVVYAGIQSVYKKAKQIGHIDAVIVDECHLISHKGEGTYHKLLDELKSINPKMIIIGFTASPYRLGHGYIYEDDALFDDIIEGATIQQLQHLGFLAKLHSKFTKTHFDLSNVHKRGGDWVESELQEACDDPLTNQEIVKEIIAKSQDRKSILIFCTGIEHAENIKNEMIRQGVTTECVTGLTDSDDRDWMLNAFKDGRIRAITNVGVLTTGFDHPNLDCIALLRPTMSPGLYLQMVGRGFRIKEHTDHCKILDFAGLVSLHGPVTAIRPPKKKGGKGEGPPPCKNCPECGEILPVQATECSACGYIFKAPDPNSALYLHDDDIMGNHETKFVVYNWLWRLETSKAGYKQIVTYYYDNRGKIHKEYFGIEHPKTSRRAKWKLANLGESYNMIIDPMSHEHMKILSNKTPPKCLILEPNGDFKKIKELHWHE